MIVDYAHPTMMAEKALSDMHWAMCDNDFDKAMEFALIAVTEARLAYNAIKHQKDVANELNKR